jgi:hypothetical protein
MAEREIRFTLISHGDAMPRTRLRSRISAVVLVVVASACGSDGAVGPNTPNPPQTPNTTLEQALGELTLPVLATAGSSISGLFPGGAQLGARCAYAADSQRFVCPPATASGLTINQSFTLLTASGAKQSAFDHATTESVRANTKVAGSVAQDGATLTLDAEEQLTLSGLVTGAHTINGTGTAHIVGTLPEGSVLDISMTSSIASLVIPASTTPGAQVWPVSGTIVVETSASLTGFPSSTSRLTLMFNGTSKVNVTVTEDGVTQTCQQDLAMPAESPTCG